jgi:hypothetical protein
MTPDATTSDARLPTRCSELRQRRRRDARSALRHSSFANASPASCRDHAVASQASRAVAARERDNTDLQSIVHSRPITGSPARRDRTPRDASAVALRLLEARPRRNGSRLQKGNRTMNARIILAAGTLGTLLSSSAFADDGVTATADAPKMSTQAQFELLPVGSASAKLNGQSQSHDTEIAYGISAGFDYALAPFLSVGVAPRLVFNVKSKDAAAGTKADKEIDLRARVVGHLPVARGLEAYASLSPGYAFVLSSVDGVDAAKGFSIAGAAGVAYDITPQVFLSGEIGYQRAFTGSDMTIAGQKVSSDLDLSYMHIGLGAGTRF